jgi:hypothetical protein
VNADPVTTQSITLTLAEVIGFVGGIIGLFAFVLGFFIRRGVFKEIDDLKEGKQDKPFCGQQLALCQKDFNTVCGDIETIKDELKEGTREFKLLHQKMDRLLGAFKVKFDDLNEK